MFIVEIAPELLVFQNLLHIRVVKPDTAHNFTGKLQFMLNGLGVAAFISVVFLLPTVPFHARHISNYNKCLRISIYNNEGRSIRFMIWNGVWARAIGHNPDKIEVQLLAAYSREHPDAPQQDRHHQDIGSSFFPDPPRQGFFLYS